MIGDVVLRDAEEVLPSMEMLESQLADERRARVAAEKEAEVLRELLWAIGRRDG